PDHPPPSRPPAEPGTAVQSAVALGPSRSRNPREISGGVSLRGGARCSAYRCQCAAPGAGPGRAPGGPAGECISDEVISVAEPTVGARLQYLRERRGGCAAAV